MCGPFKGIHKGSIGFRVLEGIYRGSFKGILKGSIGFRVLGFRASDVGFRVHGLGLRPLGVWGVAFFL